MPVRSKIEMLPKEVRDELERRITERAFSGYEELAGWLQQQGYQIAEHNVQRFGSKLFRKMESFKNSVLQAQALAHIAPEDRDSVVDISIDLLNERVFAALIEAEQLGHAEIARLAHTLSELSRLSIARQSWTKKNNRFLEEDEWAARERLTKGRRARAYAAVREALAAVKSLKTGMVRSEAEHPGVSSAEFDEDAGAMHGLVEGELKDHER